MKLKITPEMRAKWKVINKQRRDEGDPPLNFPALIKTRDRIDAIPLSYSQSTFVEKSENSPCGTVECLAGEGIIASSRSVRKGVTELFALDRVGQVSTKAQRLFGFTWEEADNAFDGGAMGWPERYRGMYANANTQRQRAHAAIAYLTSIIRTGKVVE